MVRYSRAKYWRSVEERLKIPTRTHRKSEFLGVRLGDWFMRWRRRKPLTGFWKFLVGTVTLVLTVWGLFTIWDYYEPSIEVAPTEWRTHDPFNSDFIVTNKSHYALRNFLANCFIVKAQSLSEPDTLRMIVLSHYMTPIALLEPGKPKTVQCRNTMIALPPPVIADLALRLEYQRPWFWKWGEVDFHRFGTELDPATGDLKWEALAMSEPMELPPVK